MLCRAFILNFAYGWFHSDDVFCALIPEVTASKGCGVLLYYSSLWRIPACFRWMISYLRFIELNCLVWILEAFSLFSARDSQGIQASIFGCFHLLYNALPPQVMCHCYAPINVKPRDRGSGIGVGIFYFFSKNSSKFHLRKVLFCCRTRSVQAGNLMKHERIHPWEKPYK